MAVEETWTFPTGWGQWATWNGAPDAEMRAPTKWMGRKTRRKVLERTAVPGVSDGGIDAKILIHGQQNFRFHFQRLPLCFCWMKTMKSWLNAGKWVGRFLKKLFLLLFLFKCQLVLHHSIALKDIYNFAFYCVKIGPTVRPQIHENGVRVRAPSIANFTLSAWICGRTLGPID